MPIDIPALRKITEAATPGKWEPASKGSRIVHIHGVVSVEGVIECDDGKDAAFISAFHNSAIALLDALEAAERERDENYKDAAAYAEVAKNNRLRAEAAEAEVARLRAATESVDDPSFSPETAPRDGTIYFGLWIKGRRYLKTQGAFDDCVEDHRPVSDADDVLGAVLLKWCPMKRARAALKKGE